MYLPSGLDVVEAISLSKIGSGRLDSVRVSPVCSVVGL